MNNSTLILSTQASLWSFVFLYPFLLLTQYFSMKLWATALATQQAGKKVPVRPCIEAGIVWGCLGVGVFKITAFAVWNADLFVWALESGVWLGYLACCAVISSCMVILFRKYSQNTWLWALAIPVIAGVMAYDISVVEWIHDRMWKMVPEQVSLMTIYGCLFYGTISLGQMLLGPEQSASGTVALGLDSKKARTFFGICAIFTLLLIVCQVLQINSLHRKFPHAEASLIAQPFTNEKYLFGLLGGATAMFLLLTSLVGRNVLGNNLGFALWNGGLFSQPLPGQRFALLDQLATLLKESHVLVVLLQRKPVSPLKQSDTLNWFKHTALWGDVQFSPAFASQFPHVLQDSSFSLKSFFKNMVGADSAYELYEVVQSAETKQKKRLSWTLRPGIDARAQVSFKVDVLYTRGTDNTIESLQIVLSDVTASFIRESQANNKNSLMLTTLRIIGHDLATPLNNIQMSTEILEMTVKNMETTPGTTRIQQQVERIKRNSSEVGQKLKEALRVAKNNHLDVDQSSSTVDLYSVLKEIIAIHCQKHKYDLSRVRLEVVPGTHLQAVSRFALDLVLNNLISNAIKYSPGENSSVTIGIHELAGHPAGFQSQLVVSDTGIGMPEYLRTRMRKAYLRSAEAAHIEGNGLGLSIIEHGMALLRGTIEFHPNSPKGTVAIASLPNAMLINPTESQLHYSVASN